MLLPITAAEKQEEIEGDPRGHYRQYSVNE